MKRIGLSLLTAAIGGLIAVGGYKLTEPKRFVSFDEDQQKAHIVPVSIASSRSQDSQATGRLSNSRNLSNVSSSGLPDFVQPAAMATPAVVHITTTYSAKVHGGSDELSDMFGDFFGGSAPQQRGPMKAFGSGVIISPDGYIVTNNHVIEDANNIQVVLENKKSFKAKLIGTDPNTDIALLKVQGEDLPILKFGNSDQVKVGEWVLAVGNPFNLTSTVTAGIVSAKGRSIGILGNGSQNPHGHMFGQGNANAPKINTAVESFIQTDAAVNRGNSGGALVNMNGQLVGINSAIASGGGNYEGYSFAVPVNLVKKVLDDLRNFGAVQRGFLGVNIEELNAELVNKNNLNDKDLRGVYVAKVEDASAAKVAGIQSGDVITSIQGVNVNSNGELQEQVARYRPGDALSVGVLRKGNEKLFKVVLRNRQGDMKLFKKETAAASTSLSISTTQLSKTELNKFEIPFGVKVTRVESTVLKDAGLKPGFIILKINDQEMKSPDDVNDAVSSSNDGISVEYIDPKEPHVIQSFQRSTRN